LSTPYLLPPFQIGGVVLVFGITGRFLGIYHVVKLSTVVMQECGLDLEIDMRNSSRDRYMKAFC